MIEHLHVWVAITAPFRAVSLCHFFKCEHLGVMDTYVVCHVNNQKMGFGCECTPLIPTTDHLCMYAHNWYLRRSVWCRCRHTWYLSFFLHEQNIWRIKFTPKKRVNYDKIHSKLPIFCVIRAKYTVNCQFFALNL